MGTLIVFLVFAMCGGLFFMSKLPEGLQNVFGIGLLLVLGGLAVFGRFFRMSVSKK